MAEDGDDLPAAASRVGETSLILAVVSVVFRLLLLATLHLVLGQPTVIVLCQATQCC
jgi:hypothetical protein